MATEAKMRLEQKNGRSSASMGCYASHGRGTDVGVDVDVDVDVARIDE